MFGDIASTPQSTFPATLTSRLWRWMWRIALAATVGLSGGFVFLQGWVWLARKVGGLN